MYQTPYTYNPSPSSYNLGGSLGAGSSNPRAPAPPQPPKFPTYNPPPPPSYNPRYAAANPMPGYGGGAGYPSYGGGRGEGGGGDVTTQINLPPPTPYVPSEGNPELEALLNRMGGYGEGLMDPESEYYQRLRETMTGRMGAETAAGMRSAALRAAYGGYGAGASPELLETQGELARAGIEARAGAEAQLRLAAPQLGAQIAAGTYGPQLGLSEMVERSRQYGAGLGEEARQFGGELGIRQQELAAQRAQTAAELNARLQEGAAQRQHEANLAAQEWAYRQAMAEYEAAQRQYEGWG